ncbi:MAG: primosomal protein N' [Oryzihumus sp.]
MTSEGAAGPPAAGEQLELVRAGARRKPAARAAEGLAEVDPVALVAVEVGLPHLDRPFEYSVPASLAETALAGVRVKVRFAGQDVDGFVLERRAQAEHAGRLAPLRKVVSPEPVLTPATLALCRAVADRYAGTLEDVLRLAVPPRHATAEKALAAEPPATDPLPAPDPVPWEAYPAGPSLLRRIAEGQAPAASWLATPTSDPARDWPAALAVAAATALSAGRGALLVVPDHRDVDRVDAALKTVLGPGRHVRLTADQGPQARYTAWLKVLRGHVRVVVGTRAATFAPVRDLGLVAWWDDGDDLHDEPRAPYPHVREVLLARARLEGTAVLSGGFTRSVAVQQLVEAGSLRPVVGAPADLRRAAPRVQVAGEGSDLERDPAAAAAHLPSAAWRAAKAALARGPVLIQVPRRGYVPSLSCQTCRMPARCSHCHGPLALVAADAPPVCRWCGKGVQAFDCPHCHGRTVRAGVVGARRTAEELGRAFAGVPVHTSGAGDVLASVAGRPSLVIATPGAEPVAEGGYAATLLLDAWALLDRPSLDAAQEAERRWLAAAALTRGAADGGLVVLCGAPLHTTLPAIEALVRWDPAWFAARELAERRELRLPPTVAMAQLVASRRALADALEHTSLPEGVERLGPLPASVGGPAAGAARRGRGPAPARPGGSARAGETDAVAPERMQLLVRGPLADGPALASAMAALKAVRSARKEKESVTVRMDPSEGIG